MAAFFHPASGQLQGVWTEGRKAEGESRGPWSSRKDAAPGPHRQCREQHAMKEVHCVLAE